MLDQLKNTLVGSGRVRPRTDGGTLLSDARDADPPEGTDSLESDDTHQSASAAEAIEAANPAVDIDQVFEVLKNKRRRYVLRYLLARDEQVTLGELAEQIAAWECEKDVRQISSQERKRVYVGLYQCHLPKMDDVGAVSYNKPRGNIESGDNFALFERYLPAGESVSDRPHPIRSVIRRGIRFLSRD